MITPEQVKQWIAQGMDNSDITVEGDGQHFFATIVSASFDGKTRVQRQQMVYQVLGDKMRSEIHALSMKTLTPEQAQTQH